MRTLNPGQVLMLRTRDEFERILFASPADIERAVQLGRRERSMLPLHAPAPTDNPDVLFVRVRLLPETTPSPRPRWPLYAAGGAVALGTVGALGWAALEAIHAAARAATAAGPAILGVVVILVLIGLALVGRSCTTTVTITHKH